MPGRFDDPTQLQKGRRLAALLHAFMRRVRMATASPSSSDGTTFRPMMARASASQRHGLPTRAGASKVRSCADTPASDDCLDNGRPGQDASEHKLLQSQDTYPLASEILRPAGGDVRTC